LQRLLDRQGGSDPRPISQEYLTVEDNIDGISDWFSSMREKIKVKLDPYLEM